MITKEGVIKAIVSFFRDDSEITFERNRSSIPINDANTVLELKKHPVSFLGQSITIEARRNKNESSYIVINNGCSGVRSFLTILCACS